MPDLRRRLPNLNALLCFEAAGRHLSFTLAAEELAVTQGAVSRQVRVLEEQLGLPLFRRGHRSIALTDAGRRYHHLVSVALEHLAGATDDLVAKPAGKQVTVATTAAIAMYWLMPRLPDLNQRYPEIDVQVLATDSDLAQSDVVFDVGIQYGHGRWPSLQVKFLAEGEVVPVCSPKLLPDGQPFAEAEALLTQPLLHLDDQGMAWVCWSDWFRAAGLQAPPASPGRRLNTYPLLNKAAFEGHGIALGMRHLVEEHFEQGWLTIACARRVKTELNFYVVRPQKDQRGADCQIVEDWIVDQFYQQGEDAAGPESLAASRRFSQPS